MLRITRTDTPNEQSSIELRLAGSVAAEWSALLESECRVHLDAGRRVVLDFSEVRFLDPGAVALVARLRAEGVGIAHPTPIMRDLLEGA